MFGNRSQLDDLLDRFGRWDADFDSFFGAPPWVSGVRSVRQGSFPPLNVGSNPDSVDVYLFAAGLDTKSLDLSLQQNLLTVSGKREQQADEEATYYRQERFNGSFQRVLTLPEDVDPDKVEASYRDGILHIRVGRREEVKPRRITVN
jgi:HSP20 family protein